VKGQGQTPLADVPNVGTKAINAFAQPVIPNGVSLFVIGLVLLVEGCVTRASLV
jgi:hypothetical protein